ncbi:MAG: Holliday junction resolvase RuvX [Actinobacteria bacterium]|nr:Holliday junction resolvase RuvX [Actinomycetota bacterium]
MRSNDLWILTVTDIILEAIMRYLAVDYGTKRIGLAICDELEIAASPLAQIKSRARGHLFADAQAVFQVTAEYGVAEYVVGLPYNMDGSLGPQAQLCQKFAQALGEVTAKPVHLFDERLTSEVAEAKLLKAGLSGKKRRARTDMVAAAVILQSFLEAKDR